MAPVQIDQAPLAAAEHEYGMGWRMSRQTILRFRHGIHVAALRRKPTFGMTVGKHHAAAVA